jgi:hypothetical protein
MDAPAWGGGGEEERNFIKDLMTHARLDVAFESSVCHQPPRVSPRIWTLDFYPICFQILLALLIALVLADLRIHGSL